MEFHYSVITIFRGTPMNTVKNRAILALALCALAVMPVQAMNNDTYAAAIEARDASRVYALLIAGKPIPAGVISDFCFTKDVVDKNLARAENSTYVTRDEIEFQSEKSDRLNEIANVFCAFIERGNLKKPEQFLEESGLILKKRWVCLTHSVMTIKEK